MKKLLSFFLSLAVACSCVLPSYAFASPDDVALSDPIAKILKSLENGTATEVFEEIDLSTLTPTDIQNDIGLSLIVSDIIENEIGILPGIDPLSYTYTLSGVAYTDTITDASGSTVKYYLAPRATVSYANCSHYGGTGNWYSKLYVYEYVTLDGVVQSAYENRIKLKNITGSIGVGPNIDFSDVTVTKSTSTPLSVNYLALLGSLLSASNTTEAAIISALASITPSTQLSASQKYTLSNTRNMVKCAFASGVTVNESDHFVKINVTASTTDPNKTLSVSVPVVFNWAYSVYKGTSSTGSATIKKSYTVIANNAS